MNDPRSPFVHFSPTQQDFDRRIVLRRAGAATLGARRWCHVLAFGSGEVAHCHLPAGTTTAAADFGAPTIAFRIAVEEREECLHVAPSHGIVTFYPDGCIPPTAVARATHEFFLLAGECSLAHANARDVTAGTLSDIWRLILLLRRLADAPRCEAQMRRVWERAMRFASRSAPACVARAGGYFERCWFSEPRIADAAAQSGISAEHLARAFRAAYEISPTGYLRQLRMSAAAGLLWGSRLAAGDIAALCGFYDQAHLSREIRRLIGFTPVEFRNLAPCLGKRQLFDLTG